MLERDIEKYLVKEIRVRGGRAYKFVSPGNNGVPDRVVCLPNGKTVFVELKTDTGRLSEIQKAQIRKLTDMRQETRVVYGIGGVKDFLREVDQWLDTQKSE